ncbi:MAG: hypothetical protein IPL53_25030 [Ignavibacteria bacterium]|nr:hypothetical protein [Ignavibacteria bacterium]
MIQKTWKRNDSNKDAVLRDELNFRDFQDAMMKSIKSLKKIVKQRKQKKRDVSCKLHDLNILRMK